MKQIEFARRAGVSQAAISLARHTILKDAMVGKRIDAGHPDAVAYLERKRVAKPPPVVAKEKRGASADPVEIPPAVPKDIRVFLEYPLGKLIEKFGTSTQFLDFLGAAQKIEIIHHRRLTNAKIERELVSRDMVQVCIIDVFAAAHLALLSDGAKTIAAGAMAKAASGTEQAEVERYVHDVISSHLKKLQITTSRALAGYGRNVE